MPQALRIILLLLASAGIAAFLFVTIPVAGWWFQTLAAGAPVSILALARAWLRRLPVHEIVTAHLITHKSGVAVPFEKYLRLRERGGGPVRVATMLTAMRVAEAEADPEQIFRLEIEGRLADYMNAWQAAASQGQAPPEPPNAHADPC